MHSIVFCICTKHARITIKLNCLLCVKSRAEKNCEYYRIMRFYVFKLIVQVLVAVWYLTFNKASAFAKWRTSLCALQCVVHVRSGHAHSWADSPICRWEDHSKTWWNGEKSNDGAGGKEKLFKMHGASTPVGWPLSAASGVSESVWSHHQKVTCWKYKWRGTVTSSQQLVY